MRNSWAVRYRLNAGQPTGAMAELCKKLPERYNRLKARAALAQRTVEALKA